MVRPYLMSAENILVYAALILNDDDKEISANSLKKIVDASGAKLEKAQIDIWAEYLAKADLADLISNSLAGGAGCGGGAAPAESAGGAAPAQEAKNEEPEESAPLDLADMFGDF